MIDQKDVAACDLHAAQAHQLDGVRLLRLVNVRRLLEIDVPAGAGDLLQRRYGAGNQADVTTGAARVLHDEHAMGGLVRADQAAVGQQCQPENVGEASVAAGSATQRPPLAILFAGQTGEHGLGLAQVGIPDFLHRDCH